MPLSKGFLKQKNVLATIDFKGAIVIIQIFMNPAVMVIREDRRKNSD
jgi:hypothetical protein